MQKRTSIVLEGCGVCHVTDGAELTDLCPQLKELYLASNNLSQWTDVRIPSHCNLYPTCARPDCS